MAQLYIGESPSGEHCEPVGPNYNATKAKAECRAYISQIRRVLGEEPPGAKLFVPSNPHVAGTYHTVEIKYDPNNKKARDYAYKCEGANIEYWDDLACQELNLETVIRNKQSMLSWWLFYKLDESRYAGPKDFESWILEFKNSKPSNVYEELSKLDKFTKQWPTLASTIEAWS